MAGRLVYACRLNRSSKSKSRFDMEIPAHIRKLIAVALVLGSIGIGADELERLERDGVI
jgi:hypothetical protein